MDTDVDVARNGAWCGEDSHEEAEFKKAREAEAKVSAGVGGSASFFSTALAVTILDG